MIVGHPEPRESITILKAGTTLGANYYEHLGRRYYDHSATGIGHLADSYDSKARESRGGGDPGGAGRPCRRQARRVPGYAPANVGTGSQSLRTADPEAPIFEVAYFGVVGTSTTPCRSWLPS